MILGCTFCVQFPELTSFFQGIISMFRGLFLRYADDILAAFEKEQDLLNFLNFLNNKHPKH